MTIAPDRRNPWRLLPMRELLDPNPSSRDRYDFVTISLSPGSISLTERSDFPQAAPRRDSTRRSRIRRLALAGEAAFESILIGIEAVPIVCETVETDRGMIRRKPTCAATAGRAAIRNRETPMDDPALVEALQAGDPQAPRLLIEQYQGVVFGLCYRMMSHRQDAEDVVQETFLRALRAIAGFDVARPLRPWLLEIAANRCRTALSRRARRPPSAAPESIEDRRRSSARTGRPRRPGRRSWNGDSASSGRNIAWSSSCSTSKICRTRRSPRRSRDRSAR